MSRLIIVESPSKARTLARFLGSEYIVLASMGHVRDLPKSKMGVDVEAGFTPQYELIKGKEKQIRDLRAAVKKASSTLLAADPDREGEAIAWHLAEALGLNNPDRIVFHEITKLAVDAALAHPRKIDRSLVSAQEARRVIDRLVGYRLSPLLWRKVRAGLSAGRVQSVAVRLVVDRETEIDAFVPVESWTIDALLAKDGSNPFSARLVARRGDTDAAEREKLELGTEAEAAEVITALGLDANGAVTEKTPAFVVRSIDVKETTRRPLPPHTTSTLQQDASSRLRMSPKRTMSIAQELYEGVELGSAGSTGLITYMRTNSIRISDAARDDAAKHITTAFGKDYVGTGAVRRKAAVNVQDAHEAIRPTDVNRTPDSISSSLSPGQLKVYDLIWRRFVASQMSPAKYLNTTAMIDAADYVFRASGSLITFEGFQKVWKRDEEKDKDTTLPALAEQREAQMPRDRRGAALHPASAPIHRGDPDQGARGARHRPPLDIRRDHRGDPGAPVRSPAGATPASDRARQDGRRRPPPELSRDRRRRFHRRPREATRTRWRRAPAPTSRRCANGTSHSRRPSSARSGRWSGFASRRERPARSARSARSGAWSCARESSASSSAVRGSPTASTSRIARPPRRSRPARCARAAASRW